MRFKELMASVGIDATKCQEFRPGFMYLEAIDLLTFCMEDTSWTSECLPTLGVYLLRHPSRGHLVGFQLYGIKDGIPAEVFCELMRMPEVKALLGVA